MQTALPQPAAAEPLARLLLQWGVAPASTPPVAERLGGWLGWADAIGLSQVLATPPAAGSDAGARREAIDWAEAALARLRDELSAAFDDALLARESAEAAPDGVPLADLLAPYRLHHAQQQRSMAARIGTLRERLRPRLAEVSGTGARLAQLDAVFERAVVAQERQALAGLPALLSRRAATHHTADPRRWRARFWADLQRALRAELDLRLQPVLGLIEALHQAES
ncbi:MULTISPECIES: DUF3348 family protein [unclassified Roseateles]|uniref:DUF3348 family protein n=1 Tax=unclassified Roseateles TaxID=2626991 RepID=UPI0007019DB2|nr:MULTISPECIES: DUF3348 family protein [unclassified Roseateles]KQW45686.1 hypothetical protein ASC81_12405 [Pelomonas sp. Root405]KRA72530.1 hypothetical protein ASD88_12405 [Pelomonas sp. Root662]